MDSQLERARRPPKVRPLGFTPEARGMGSTLDDLTREQLELLRELVGAVREVPPGQSKAFITASSMEGTSVLALAGDYRREHVSKSDIVELADQRLIRITEYRKYGDLCFYVTNRGMRCSRLSEPTTLAEQRIRAVEERLPEAYRLAQRLLDEAAAKLSKARDEHEWSEVGHKCREAMQEFAAVLYDRWVPAERQMVADTEKTINRIKAVVGVWKTDAGQRTSEFLDALVEFWRGTNGIVQKVEHRSQREDRPLVLRDAERAVLYTYLLMAELSYEEQTRTSSQNVR